jgi:hypothetical protein
MAVFAAVWLLEREKCLSQSEWVMLEPDYILLFNAVIALKSKPTY